MVAFASVRRHRLHHPQRKDAEPILVRARSRGRERAVERPERLDEARGQAGREHAKGDGGGVLNLCNDEVLQRVSEEHPGVVAFEPVGRPLEVHEGVLGQPAHDAGEKARPGRGAAPPAPKDDEVDA
ncbi:hypothetical protein [Sorangium cellulosum]|uniref:hypothetical protein n=1 Tax=Sorangium cellulosum TaxID=56 RepID=UPI001E5ACE9C|nr:hypothetical protein [Sorangium cellulosum]